jgi:hypothetical protein
MVRTSGLATLQRTRLAQGRRHHRRRARGHTVPTYGNLRLAEHLPSPPLHAGGRAKAARGSRYAHAVQGPK